MFLSMLIAVLLVMRSVRGRLLESSQCTCSSDWLLSFYPPPCRRIDILSAEVNN